MEWDQGDLLELCQHLQLFAGSLARTDHGGPKGPTGPTNAEEWSHVRHYEPRRERPGLENELAHRPGRVDGLLI